MNDLTPETIAELRRRHAALTPFALRFMSGGPGGDPFITLASEDGSTPLPDPAFDAVLLFAKLAAAALPALLDAAAERDRLAGARDEGKHSEHAPACRLGDGDCTCPNPYQPEGETHE